MLTLSYLLDFLYARRYDVMNFINLSYVKAHDLLLSPNVVVHSVTGYSYRRYPFFVYLGLFARSHFSSIPSKNVV